MRALAGTAFAILAGLRLATLAGAQEPPDDPVESFGERVEVELVEVEVRVIDKKGRPVTGLTREDFRVYDDGRPVEIEYFTEYRDAVAAAEKGAAEAAAPAAEPGETPAEVAPAALEDSTYLVIFLDQVHLEPGGRSRILEDLGKFVTADLPPDVPVMVVSYDGGVEITQDFTTERPPVLDALAAEEEAAAGVFEAVRRRSALRRMEHIYLKWVNTPACPEGTDPCNCALPEMETAAREHASEVGAGVEQTLGGLASVVAALRGVPGRKLVLLVTDGLEARPGLDLFHYIADICPQHEQEVSRYYTSEDLLSAIHEVASDSSANRVTVYTLEATGLRGDAADMSVGSSQFRPSLLTQRMLTGNLQHSLFVMAEQTGGKAVLNANRFDQALDDLAEDQGTYYSLGYRPGHAGDGRVHLIRVEVDAPNYQLRYRKSYRDKPLETRIAERALASLLFDIGDNPLGVRAETGEAAALAGGGHRVPVRIWVPLAGLTLVPDAGGLEGRLRVVLAVSEPDGSLGAVRQKLVPIEVGPADGEGRLPEQLVEVSVDLAGDSHLLALAVRDEIGGETSYLRHEVRLGALSQTRLEPQR